MGAVVNSLMVIGLLGGFTYLVYRFIERFDEKNALHLRQLFVNQPTMRATVQYWSELGAVTWDGSIRGQPFEGRMTTIGVDVHKTFYTQITIQHGLRIGVAPVFLSRGTWPNFAEGAIPATATTIEVSLESQRATLPLPLQDPLFWSLALKGGIYLTEKEVGCYVPHQARTAAQKQRLKQVLEQLDALLQYLQQQYAV